MTSKNSSKKTRGLFFWGVIREKVSAFTLIYLFDMPNDSEIEIFYFISRVYLIALIIIGTVLNIKALSSLREAAKVCLGTWNSLMEQ